METPEKSLIAACLRKDRKAQQRLYETYKIPMFRLCLRYARDRQEAEDLLQEGFIKVFKDLAQYRAEGALGGWIRRVMVNNALQYIRKNRHLFPTVDMENIPEPQEEVAPLFGNDRLKMLTAMIRHLPVGYRTVFNLYVLEDYSHQEIATSLGISVNTSKSQLHKAKAMLRQLLEGSLVISKK